MMRSLEPARARLVAWAARPGRYAIVGALGAGINNVVVILADQEGISYLTAMVAAFIVTVPTCYVIHSRFTFGEDMSWSRFARFGSGAATGFPISVAAMALLCSGLRVPVAIATPVVTLLLFAWNYSLARWSIAYRRAGHPA